MGVDKHMQNMKLPEGTTAEVSCKGLLNMQTELQKGKDGVTIPTNAFSCNGEKTVTVGCASGQEPEPVNVTQHSIKLQCD